MMFSDNLFNFFYLSLKVILKNNCTTCRMIKNKILDIKIIFKNILGFQIDFCSTQIKKKTIFQNCF